MQWILPPRTEDCEALAAQCGVPRLIATLLINRGITSPHEAADFMVPALAHLYPPDQLGGALEAASLIADTVREGKRIVLYGDYDVDGITGVSILWHVLRSAGADVTFYVPHRIQEGYGLHAEAVRRLARDGADLLISVDCGITAVEVARELRALGVRFIVTDHHAPQEQLPDADVIVHPTVGLDYPNANLCGAGVAFKLAWALARKISHAERVTPEFRRLLMDLLPLAGLGTVADVVPLVFENRILAHHGVQALPSTRIPGLRALIATAGLANGRIDSSDVGFKLAPRLNAAGRMGHAQLAIELLTRASEERAREIALYLEDHNRKRQAEERRIAKEAFAAIERDGLAGDARRAIVVANEGWHAGVIGVVASRVTGAFHRPAVMISLANGEGQGSARSVPHFAINEALSECGEHLISHGGHRMAAGLRIRPDRIPEFTAAFVELANNRLTGADLQPRLRLDAEVGVDELTLPTAEMISRLGPFGEGNPRPQLATGWLELAEEPRLVGRGERHLQATLQENGRRVRGIGFGLAKHIEDLKQHRRCRAAFEPIVNEFNGRRSVEMRLIDLQFPQCT